MFKILLLIIFIFFIGCSSVNELDNNQTTNNITLIAENDSVSETADLEINPPGCGGWKCISSSARAYQSENCSFGKSEKCSTSCVNGTCAPPKVCISGFKCSSAKEYGFQKEDCSWSNFNDCPFGCNNGECNPMPEGYNETNQTNQTNTSEAETPAAETPVEIVTIYSIKPGEEHQLGGQNFRIYNLESERVIFVSNITRSDWLAIGDSFTLGDSTLEIKDILFQSYEGGTQLVEYTIT